MKATCALCENEEKDAVQDDQDDQDDDDLHQAGVHVEPAVVDAPVVVVLEAHVEQDDEGRHAPPNLKITISTSVSHHLHQHVLKPNLKITISVSQIIFSEPIILNHDDHVLFCCQHFMIIRR